MRIPLLFLAFALASCGSDEQADTAAVRDESSASDITAVNDVTAIDAATGQAADMAADVNYMFDENEVNGTDSNMTNESENEGR